MNEIPLTQGKVALVDDVDYEELAKHKWCASASRSGRNEYYALRKEHINTRWQTLLMHRVVWTRHHGPIPEGKEIDHINGDGLDNRKTNMRLCTHANNMANYRKKKAHSSHFKGVSWQKDCHRWKAHIKKDGGKTYLGCYISEEDAARAYDTKAKELFGEFANLNFKGERDVQGTAQPSDRSIAEGTMGSELCEEQGDNQGKLGSAGYILSSHSEER